MGICRWWRSRRTTAPAPDCCWRRSRGRWPARVSRTSPGTALPTARTWFHEASRVSPLGIAAAVLVLLGVLILVHELGHFVFAKLFDVKVLCCSLGFGPRIVGFKYGETEYRLSAIPLGG